MNFGVNVNKVHFCQSLPLPNKGACLNEFVEWWWKKIFQWMESLWCLIAGSSISWCPSLEFHRGKDDIPSHIIVYFTWELSCAQVSCPIRLSSIFHHPENKYSRAMYQDYTTCDSVICVFSPPSVFWKHHCKSWKCFLI